MEPSNHDQSQQHAGAEPAFGQDGEQILRGRTLTPQIHWLRLFANMHNGQATITEALLDNQTWPEGEALVARHAAGEGFRASRMFMMMVPADSGSR